jgi:hypothetical protein
MDSHVDVRFDPEPTIKIVETEHNWSFGGYTCLELED